MTKRPKVFPGPKNNSSLGRFVCPEQLKVPHGHEFRLKFGTDHIVDDCGAPCYKLFFSVADVTFVRKVVGITALISTLACVLALITYAVK